jgi:hypothetical protein
MDDESEKPRMKDTTNQLASQFILNLGSAKITLIKEYVQLAGEEIVDAEHNMVEW